MMNHTLKLQPTPFNKIREGTKIIESRLYDEKRQQIKLGETITFKRQPDLKESIKAQVVGILRFQTFSDLINSFPPSYFGWNNKESALKEISQFYSKEQERAYTVVGIKIKLL